MMLIAATLALILSAIFNSEMDTIVHRPHQAWVNGWLKRIIPASKYERFRSWYLENRWEEKSWWLKVPFSFLLDGWHNMKAARVYCLTLPYAFLVAVYFSINWTWGFLLAVPSYALHGIIFEIFFND